MSFAVVIPAQETNKYHELGDLAPFGDTRLLEWKIMQCKEFVKITEIYISSDSYIIEEIAKHEGVNFIKRENKISYDINIKNTLNKVNEDIILWTNPTSPFLGFKDYLSMIEKYKKYKNIKSLVTVNSKYDYIYYDNKRLNFLDKFTTRSKLNPIKIVTNGCYIINKEFAQKNGTLYSENPFLYELDYLSAIEIKDLHSYQISKELISTYFKRELDV